jgi:nucleoside-triphosphatase THEP1
MSHKIIILSAGIQTGKTTLLQQLCKQQNNIGGILTPVVEGERKFYDILQKLFFAMEASADKEKLAIGKYLFSSAAFSKANNLLLEATQKPGMEYIVIDEIGPLEIKWQQGFYQSLKKITARKVGFTLILVIRSSWVEQAMQTFNLQNPLLFNLQQMKAFFKLQE